MTEVDKKKIATLMRKRTNTEILPATGKQGVTRGGRKHFSTGTDRSKSYRRNCLREQTLLHCQRELTFVHKNKKPLRCLLSLLS